MIKAVTDKTNNNKDVVLKHFLWRFFLALIYYVIKSVLFRSSILSFCTILGRLVCMIKAAEKDKIKAKRQ